MRSLGSDVRKGDLVMRYGDWISRAEGGEGTLAFVGRKEVGLFPTQKRHLLYFAPM